MPQIMDSGYGAPAPKGGSKLPRPKVIKAVAATVTPSMRRALNRKVRPR